MALKRDFQSPLQWPVRQPRTPASQRKKASFSHRGQYLGLEQAQKRMGEELARFGGVSGYVLSLNARLRVDGEFAARQDTADPGVALYFTWRKRPYGFGSDRWTRQADNIAAIAAHLDAMRGIERWGVGSIEQAFTGYLALPWLDAPKPWREVLGIGDRPGTLAEMEDRFTKLAKIHHPDRPGGNAQKMAELNRAIGEARDELRSP